MSYSHKKLLACDYVNETFNTYGNQIQEVSFSPIVYSFFPERSERAKLVEEMVNEIYQKNDYIYETYFIIEFQNETFEFEFALDQITNNQLIIVDVFAYKCFGHEIPTYH